MRRRSSFGFGLVVLGLVLGACSADVTRALPTPGAQRQPPCQAGTFLGSMTLTCPEVVR